MDSMDIKNSAADAAFEEAVKSALALIGKNSVQSAPCAESPFGRGVAQCLAAVAEDARAHGFTVGEGDGYYVWAEIGQGDLFGILGHVDTVPIGEGWTAEPLGEIKDGVMYGRGVLDDKGPMILALYAVYSLIDEGRKPKRRIRFIFGGNEESGWKCIERYLQKEEIPPEGISPDADFPVINCEKGVAHIELKLKKPADLLSMRGGDRANVVMPLCKASIDGSYPDAAQVRGVTAEEKDGVTELTAIGKAAHGSTPREGDNAAWKILQWLALNVGGEYVGLRDMLCDDNGKGLGIDCRDEKSGALTCNIGIIDTDSEKITLTLDIRHPVSVPRSDIEAKLKTACGAVGAETVAFHDPLYVPQDDELVRGLLSAYNKCTGEHASPISVGGATYARALPKAVAFGPIFPRQANTIHMPDERASLTDLRKTFDIYRAAFAALLFE